MQIIQHHNYEYLSVFRVLMQVELLQLLDLVIKAKSGIKIESNSGIGMKIAKGYMDLLSGIFPKIISQQALCYQGTVNLFSSHLPNGWYQETWFVRVFQ